MKSTYTHSLLTVVLILFTSMGLPLEGTEGDSKKSEHTHGPQKYYYLLSKPIESKTEIYSGKLHVGLFLGARVVMFGAWTYGIGLIPTIMMYAADSPTWPLGLMGQSLAELKFRTWLESKGMNKTFTSLRGLESIGSLSLGKTEYAGCIACRENKKHLIFLETEIPLPLEDEPLRQSGWKGQEWGRPVLISDPEKLRIRVEIKGKGVSAILPWIPNLVELKGKAPMPHNVAESWRSALKEWDSAIVDEHGNWKSWRQDLKNRDLSLGATLLLEGGKEEDLGTLAQGKMVRYFISKPLYRRLLEPFLPSSGPKFNEKALPFHKANVVPRKEAGCATLFWNLLGRHVIAD